MGHHSLILSFLARCQDEPMSAFIAIVTAFCFLRYAMCVLSFNTAAVDKQGLKTPPLVPSFIPILGNVSLKIIWNPREWAHNTKELFHHAHPVSAWLMGQKIYIIQGTQNIQTMFRQKHPSSFILHGFLLERVFSLPRSALEMYRNDDSGPYKKPNADSKVKPHNRVEYLLEGLLHRFLLGPSLYPFAQRFRVDFTKRVDKLEVGQDWEDWDDLVSFFTQELTTSFLNSLCGENLLRQHPEFLKNLWSVENGIWKLISGLPRFLFPRLYNERDKGLLALKSWHSWASKNFDPSAVDAEGDDPVWGSKFFRDRKEIFSEMEGFDQDAIATHDFAFIWGSTNNVIFSSFWNTVEVFSDPRLLSIVREEAKACLITSHSEGASLQFDMKKLLAQPVLQAIYAETLRLRIGGFYVRHQTQADLNIEGWRIPKNHYFMSSTMQGHMNPDVWSTGSCADHPVDQFWPGRFLKTGEDGTLEFTFERSQGTWAPYGGGHHACPGRQYAKMMNVFNMALMALKFDCEIKASPKAMEMSMRNFGFGIAPPKDKVPVRIRRRQDAIASA